MPRPTGEPLGLELTRTAKLVGRAFDDALAAGGGSLPLWQVLVALKQRPGTTQRQLADAVGIEGPTLTHHLGRMEDAGLVERQRDPANRRAQVVTLTDEGERTFRRLLRRVVAFDEQLRSGLTAGEVEVLRGLLGRLRTNVQEPSEQGAPT